MAEISPYCDESAGEQIRELFWHVWDDPEFLRFTPTVLHGDLIPEHIQFNSDSRRICTVTGFGLARLGDPAEDYASLLDSAKASCVGWKSTTRNCRS